KESYHGSYHNYKRNADTAGASSNSDRIVSISPYADCFGPEHQPAASTDWNSHYNWAKTHDAERLKSTLEMKLVLLFQCRARTDAQLAEQFGDISVVVARYVPNAACFNGDAGVVGTDASAHTKWARQRGRTVVLDNLKSKVLAAVDCVESSKRAAYFADVSVLVAGGALK